VDRPGKFNRKVDELTERPGDHVVGGYETLKNLDQVVLKWQNVTEHWRLLASSSHKFGHCSLSDLCSRPYYAELLRSKKLEAL
jgi:hypothetical protein